MGRNREFKRLKEKLNKKGTLSAEDMRSIKKNLKLEEILSLLELASQFPDLSRSLFSDARDFHTLLIKRFPYVFSSWKDERILEEEIACELNFLTARTCLKAQEIQDFIQAREQFELHFMRGEYSEALETIDGLEKEYGPSYWSLDSRMCMLFSGRRREVNQFYLNSQKENENIFFSTYMKISYYRFLKEVMTSYFNALLKDIWQEYKKKTDRLDPNFKVGFQVYVTSKIDPSFEYTLYDIRHLLVVSDRLTTIDQYVLLERLLSWLCANSVYNESFIAEDLLNCAALLWNKTHAMTWFNICVLGGDDLDIVPTQRKLSVNTCLERFCNGEKAQCHELCEQALLTHSNCFSLIDLLAKSGDCPKTGRPYDKLAGLIRSLYLKEKRDSEFVGLISLCNGYERIYSHFTFGIQFGVIVGNETGPIDVDEKIQYVSALLQSDYTPSKLAFFLTGEKQANFIQKYKRAIGSLYFCDWHIATYSETDAKTMGNFCCDKTSYCLNSIKACTQDGPLDPETMLPKDLDIIGRNTCKAFFFKRRFNLAIECNNIFDAISTYVQAYFCSQWMAITIDYTKIQNRITRDDKKELEYKLFYCLYAYITRFEIVTGEALSETVISSCKKIISLTKNQSPLDLLEDRNHANEAEKVYFLRNICTYDGLRRLNHGRKNAQELYEERLKIINRIIPFYEANENAEDMLSLTEEKKKISSKLGQLDIAKCINRGKIDTSWIVFSDESESAIMSIYNLFKNRAKNGLFDTYANVFRMVEEDYVKEVNRILSTTIRHGILEAELLRFIKKEGIGVNPCGAAEQKLVDGFIQDLYDFINSLMEDYIIAVNKPGDNYKLVLYVEEAVIKRSFESLPENLVGPEIIKEEYSRILEEELQKSLKQWGDATCRHIYANIKRLLAELYENSSGDLKINANKTMDRLEEETKKLNAWFMITENQETPYRLATLCETLEQEWERLKVENSQDMTLTGGTINFLYTIIRELIWNAERRSEDPEEETDIRVNIYQENNHIVFKVENCIAPEYMETIDKSVEEIRRTIESVEKADQTIMEERGIKEGKSGYKKIMRLLQRKYEGRYRIDVGHVDRQFYATISFDQEALT